MSSKADAGGDLDLLDFFKVGNAKATYEQFQQKKTSYFEKHNITLDTAEAVNIASQNVPDSARAAFVKCMGEQIGLTAYFHDDEQTSAILRIKLNTIAGDAERVIVELSGAHVQNGMSKWHGTFLHGQSHELIVVRNGPKTKIEAVLNASASGTSAVSVAPEEPTKSPNPTCKGHAGPYNFFGDKCGDNFEVSGDVVVVRFGNGNSITIPKNVPGYRASLGFWMAGDFNGDRLTDLIHIVVNNPGTENYAHVHFSQGNENFASPTAPFSFPKNANPQGDYSAAVGHWYVLDVDGDGKDDLVHDPNLPDKRIHRWISQGDGTFRLM